jgi:hypothetical protein
VSAFHAFLVGLGRVQRAPWLVAGVWMTTVAAAVPLALALDAMLRSHLGASLAANTAADAVNFDWWNEFVAQAAGLGQTFLPSIIGFSAALKNLSDLADARGIPAVIAAVVAAYMVLSAFLAGGILDRLARNRATRSRGFFGASGVFFFRFLRLGTLAALLYGFLFAVFHAWLFDTLYPALTHDLSVERTAFAYRLAAYVLFASVVLAVNIWFDYAKIRAVVEDRRSMLAALAAAGRFVTRHPGGAIGLYLMNGALFGVVLLLYAMAAPGMGRGATAWLVLLVGQLYIVLRVIIRLQFAASQIALFQSRLAHAAYMAAPRAVWPDSPAAEAIRDPQAGPARF